MEIASFAQESDARFGPRTLSDISLASNASGKGQSHSSYGTSKHVRDSRVKFMCSHGGKIMPRPSDRKLRYVGGETRMISVPRHIHYHALLLKMRDIYGSDLVLKYQLPEEDLDALVSVSCDEDLENMMEECDRLDAMEGSSRLRVFVFTSSDLDTIDLSDIADPKVSEQRYVDAVNAVQVEVSLRKSDDMMSMQKTVGTSAYSGNAQASYIENLQISSSGNVPAQKLPTTMNNVSGPITPPLSAVVTRPRKVPSDLSLTHFPANPHGIPVGFDDFLDLESGGSASSSTSSQHDIHYRYLNQRWAPIQSHVESKPYEAGETHMYDTTHVVDPNPQKGGIEGSINPPAINFLPSLAVDEQAYVNESVADNRVPDVDVNGEAPLSPGAKLQMQLQADTQSNIDANRFSGMEHQQFPSNTEYFRPVKQVLQEPQPASFFKEGLLGVGGHTVDPLHGSHDLHPQGPSSSIFPPSSTKISFSTELPATAVQPLLLSKQDNLHDMPNSVAGFTKLESTQTIYNHDSTWLALQPPVQDPSNSVFHTCSAEVSPPRKMNEVDPSTLLFTEERTLHEFDYGQKSQAPWLLPPAVASFVAPLQGHNIENGVSEMHAIHSRVANTSGNLATQAGLSLLDTLVQLDNGTSETTAMDEIPGALIPPQLTECFSGNILNSDCVMSLSFGKAQPQDIPNVELSLGTVARSELPVIKTSGDLASGLLQGFQIQNRHEDITDYSNEFGPNEIDLNGRMYMNDDSIKKTTEDALQSTGFTIRSQASLIEAWSSKREHEHDQAQVFQGKEPEEEQSTTFEKHLTVEHISSEIEVDTFKSLDDRPKNLAATAEKEAITRGLQTIRNIDLEELRELGSGTFGTVYHGKWRGTDVAIKRIKSSCFTGRPAERDRLIADFWQEACLLGQLHHPNVVAFYGVVPDGPNDTLATVTEYMVNGSLKQALAKKDRALDRRKRLLIAMDAAFGMEYLHGKNVVHFDMKCENLLVNLRDIQRPICKVGDLGLSKVKQQTMISGGVRGTLPWMAPELLNGSSSMVSEKVDVFSFGIVLWELLTGEEPYANMHYGAIIGGIVSNTLRPTIPKTCDPSWKSLMEACWSADPAKRPNFSEIARRLREMEAALHVKGHTQASTTG